MDNETAAALAADQVITIYPAATAAERLREIRAAFGGSYDPALCIQPATVRPFSPKPSAALADGRSWCPPPGRFRGGFSCHGRFSPS